MRGKDLSEFKRKVNTVMANTLKKYLREIEIILGPVKIVFRFRNDSKEPETEIIQPLLLEAPKQLDAQLEL